jgi:predicted glycosyltransferase
MKKILVAPLNWGLGHATRCMPIIKILLEQGFEILLASDGDAGRILSKEFPNLPYFELPSYNISYPSENMLYNGLVQSKNIFKTIKKEKKTIQNIVNQYNINIVISDNRFGCYTENTKNIFITHQINIKTPYRWTDFFARKINHFFIKKFDEIWIPDVKNEPSLAGTLSHGYLEKLPPCHYLGVISRFEKTINITIPLGFPKQPERYSNINILILLSGPEPQRTILEQKILAQAEKLPYDFLLVRGLVKENEQLTEQKNIKILNYATSETLNELMRNAKLIIARSGYTTLMDLALTGKKALLIPTPGQTEQEYLAASLAAKNIFTYQTQKALNLEKGIAEALEMKAWQPQFQNNIEKIVKKL